MRENAKALMKVFAMILLMTAILCGCEAPSTGSQTVDLEALTAEMEARKAAELEALKKEAADFDRHYGEGRYAKDYSAVSEKLNEAFRAKVEQDLRSTTDAEVFVKGELVFFNDELERAQRENLTLEDLLQDPHRSVKDVDVEIYAFTDLNMDTSINYEEEGGEDSLIIRKYFGELSAKFKRSSARKVVFVAREFDKTVLVEKPLEELRTMERLNSYLLDGKFYYREMREDTTYSWEGSAARLKEIRDLLKQKYQEDFMVLSSTVKSMNGTYICAPVDKPELEFELKLVAGTIEDKYLAVLAQKTINRQLEEILKTHGMEGRMVAFNALDNMTSNAVDTRHLDGELPFLDLKGGTIDLSLYYLKTPEEDIDFSKVRECIVEYQKIYPYNLSFEKGVNTYINTFFYEITEDQRNVTNHLFGMQGITEGRLRNESTIFDLDSLQITSADTDAFNYLFTHGTKGDFILSINKNVSEVSAEAFVESFKREDIWR